MKLFLLLSVLSCSLSFAASKKFKMSEEAKAYEEAAKQEKAIAYVIG